MHNLSLTVAHCINRQLMDKNKEKEKKKQIPLRISESLYKELHAWAEDDFRSINGQIEYVLTQAIKKRKGAQNDDK